jgi:hypothetical protein
MNEEPESRWRLDRHIPVSLIVTILVQTGAFVWWGASTDQKVAVLKERLDFIAPNSDRLTRVEVKVDGVQQSINRIEGYIRTKQP